MLFRVFVPLFRFYALLFRFNHNGTKTEQCVFVPLFRVFIPLFRFLHYYSVFFIRDNETKRNSVFFNFDQKTEQRVLYHSSVFCTTVQFLHYCSVFVHRSVFFTRNNGTIYFALLFVFFIWNNETKMEQCVFVPLFRFALLFHFVPLFRFSIGNIGKTEQCVFCTTVPF